MTASPLSLIGEEAVARAIGGKYANVDLVRQRARAAISAHLAALTEAGLVVVPRATGELIAAAQRWRAGLEDDGWTEDEIRHIARPGLHEIIVALEAIAAAVEAVSAAPPAQNGEATPEQEDGADSEIIGECPECGERNMRWLGFRGGVACDTCGSSTYAITHEWRGSRK